MSTYHAMYIEWLEERINAGGKEDEVVNAVNEYNRFDEEAFKKWLGGLENVSCVSCGKMFKPDATNASAEILCEEHTPK